MKSNHSHFGDKIVVIVGPTASGKSALAIKIAELFDGEIISADSRSVYRGMDIGTAKPSSEDRSKVIHHLLDVVEPNEQFNVARFKDLALKAISDIRSRGKLPILAGGTGLYIDAVIFDYKFGEPSKQEVRTQLESLTNDELYDIFQRRSIRLPKNIKNRRHLIRAIELNGLIDQAKIIRPETIVVGISTEKAILEQRIRSRAAQMFRGGVIEEAIGLGDKFGWDTESMKANIYRTINPNNMHSMNAAELLEAFVQSDLKLAKRQMTWFKRNPYILWSDDIAELLSLISDFLDIT